MTLTSDCWFGTFSGHLLSHCRPSVCKWMAEKLILDRAASVCTLDWRIIPVLLIFSCFCSARFSFFPSMWVWVWHHHNFVCRLVFDREKRTSDSCSYSCRNIHSQVFLSPKAFGLKGFDTKAAKTAHVENKTDLRTVLKVTGASRKRNNGKRKECKSTGIFPLMQLRSGFGPSPCPSSLPRPLPTTRAGRPPGTEAAGAPPLGSGSARCLLVALPAVLRGLNIYITGRVFGRESLRQESTCVAFGTILSSRGRYWRVFLNGIEPPWRQAPPNAGQETVVKVSRKCLHTRLL